MGPTNDLVVRRMSCVRSSYTSADGSSYAFENGLCDICSSSFCRSGTLSTTTPLDGGDVVTIQCRMLADLRPFFLTFRDNSPNIESVKVSRYPAGLTVFMRETYWR